LIVLRYLKETEREHAISSDRKKRIHAIGKTMVKHQEIELSESLSNINFDNGLSFFTTHRVKGSEDLNQIEAYEKVIQQILSRI
jgi:glycerol-3-phosphate O-acyltransferase